MIIRSYSSADARQLNHRSRPLRSRPPPHWETPRRHLRRTRPPKLASPQQTLRRTIATTGTHIAPPIMACDYQYVKDMTPEGYSFPSHRLQRTQVSSNRTPLVLVACGSCSSSPIIPEACILADNSLAQSPLQRTCISVCSPWAGTMARMKGSKSLADVSHPNRMWMRNEVANQPTRHVASLQRIQEEGPCSRPPSRPHVRNSYRE